MPGILDELMRAFANTQAAEEAHFDSTPSDGSSGVPSVGDLFIPSERDAFLPDEQSAPEEILPLLAEIKNAYAAGPSGERDISTDFANAIMRGGGTFSKTGDSGRVLDNLGAHNHPDSASSRAAADAKLTSANRDEDLKRFLMELAQSNKDREFDLESELTTEKLLSAQQNRKQDAETFEFEASALRDKAQDAELKKAMLLMQQAETPEEKLRYFNLIRSLQGKEPIEFNQAPTFGELLGGVTDSTLAPLKMLLERLGRKGEKQRQDEEILSPSFSPDELEHLFRNRFKR